MWEALALLGGLLLLGLVAVVVAVPILIGAQSRLRRRVEALESQVQTLAADLVRVRRPLAAEPDAVVPAPAAAAPEPAEAVQPPELSEPLAEEPPAAPETEPVMAEGSQDRPLVFTSDRFADLTNWLKENWVYAVSALSLALAGVYFVQYGIENGLLTPTMRVAGALILGLALIGAGDWMRRRNGSGPLPSGFAGAGLVSAFAGIVAARQLYGLIGPEAAFTALVGVAAIGLVLGWFHGAFLTAFALLGAFTAPFAVGGDSESPTWLYAYFLVIAATGLGIDAVRRWAWVSVLALALGYGGLWFTVSAWGQSGWLSLALLALATLAVLVPVLRLAPDHDGLTVTESLLRQGKAGWPAFPTRLAAGSVTVSSVLMLVAPADTAADSLLAFLSLAALASALAVWSARAPALADVALVPAAGFLIRLVAEPRLYQPLSQDWFSKAIDFREPESSAPATLWILMALATGITLAAAWSAREGNLKPARTAAAAVIAPAAAVAFELFWAPRPVIGAYPWALTVIALAVLMAFLAERAARADGEDRRRAAYLTLACLSLIALALFIIITKGALTLALGALIVAATVLDRRFRLPEMGWFVIAGVLVLGWRIFVEPGFQWAYDAPLWELLLSHAGALAALAAAWRLMSQERPTPRLFVESGFAALAAMLVNVLTARALDAAEASDSFWAVSLYGMPWIIVALVQVWRMQLGGWMRWVRAGLAAVFGLLGGGALVAAVFVLNPLVTWQVFDLGPPILDKLFVAYAMPAILLAGALWLMRPLHRGWNWSLGGIAAGLAALYVGLEIRRAWQGDALNAPGVMQGELYSYTIAMMVLGAGLLAAAILRRSVHLRWAAMTVIVLTVAKVFLLDAAGLAGLMRVVSFLGLGLALAGTAVLNRWARTLEAQGKD